MNADLMLYICGIIVALSFIAKIFTCKKCIVVYLNINTVYNIIKKYDEKHSACNQYSKIFLEDPTDENINKQKYIYSYFRESKCSLLKKYIL